MGSHHGEVGNVAQVSGIQVLGTFQLGLETSEVDLSGRFHSIACIACRIADPGSPTGAYCAVYPSRFLLLPIEEHMIRQCPTGHTSLTARGCWI